MFQFQAESRAIDKMETAAFADIIFLLLIFFLLSSSFILPSQIPVNPPKSSSAASQKSEPLVVTLTKAGDSYVGDEKVPFGELGNAISARLEGLAEKSVVIRGDESISLGKLVDVMDVARKAGAEKLAIATEKKGADSR